MKKFGAALLTLLVAGAIIGLWRYSARDAHRTGIELTIAVAEDAIPSFAPDKLRTVDGPLLYLFASPLKFAHLPSSLSLAEDVSLNETSRTLKVILRKDLITPAGMPLTAKTYGESLARNRRRMLAHGPGAILAGITGGNEEYPAGIQFTDLAAVTLKWDQLPEPAGALMSFAERRESFFIPESNFDENGWKNPEILDSVGPWKTKSTTRDSMTLVPAGLPGYVTRYARIQIRRLSSEQLRSLPVDKPTIVLAQGDPEIPGFGPKGPSLWGTADITPTTETGEHALLLLVTDLRADTPAGP